MSMNTFSGLFILTHYIHLSHIAMYFKLLLLHLRDRWTNRRHGAFGKGASDDDAPPQMECSHIAYRVRQYGTRKNPCQHPLHTRWCASYLCVRITSPSTKVGTMPVITQLKWMLGDVSVCGNRDEMRCVVRAATLTPATPTSALCTY